MLSVMRGHEEEITDIATHPKEMVGPISIHICLSIHPLVYLLVYPTIHSFIYQSIYPSINPFLSVFVGLCVYIS